jgi:ABC-type multidrug transport system ATPase subunit
VVTLTLQNLGKRFNRHWIFRHLNYTFQAGTAYAITGANGSGKSTLLQVLAGAVTLSEGKVELTTDHGPQTTGDNLQPATNIPENQNSALPVVRHLSSVVAPDKHHQYLSIAAPYLEVIEEMTLIEFLQFHFQFKPLLPGFTIPQIMEYVQLKGAAHKQIRHYSSGMKQRVKLAQAVFSYVPIVLLDEPLTNLDVKGEALYNGLIENFCKHRLTIVCSNAEAEMHFCKERLAIEQFSLQNK